MNNLLALFGSIVVLAAPITQGAACGAPPASFETPRKRIALTFDADMTSDMQRQLTDGHVNSWYNHELIDYLDREQVKATLFLTGMWTETYPGEAKTLAQDPLFEIANHSYSHPAFAQPCFGLHGANDADKKYELYHSQHVIQEITGAEPKFFRFPGGCHNQTDLDLVRGMGLEPIQWDVVSGDSFSTNTAGIVHNIVTRAFDGAVVVAHMNNGPNAPKTADAMKEAVPMLRDMGYQFVTLSELITETSTTCK